MTSSPRRRDAGTEPRLELNSWTRALVGILAVGALLWIVLIADAADGHGFDRFGLGPRRIGGMWGILTQPFLHASWHQLLGNTVPLLAIGWAVLLSGPAVWGVVTAWVVLVGGSLTWIIGPSDAVIVGSSGMVFGWLGYLLGRAVITRRFVWILGAVAVLSFFGSLLFGVLPSERTDIAWQSHLCSLAAGVAIAFLLHPRSPARPPARSGTRREKSGAARGAPGEGPGPAVS